MSANPFANAQKQLELASKLLLAHTKNAQEKQKLTQVDESVKSGINTNYYACIERGEVNPSFEKIQNIAKTLGLKSSEILPF